MPLLSNRPKFAEAIFDGTKKLELPRRAQPRGNSYGQG
jgi:predicted transcriptional regulator